MSDENELTGNEELGGLETHETLDPTETIEREAPDDRKESDSPDIIIKKLNAAVREERGRRRSEQERAARLEDTFQRFVASRIQVETPPPPPRETIPDPTEDLGGHLYAKQQRLERELAEHRQALQREESARQQYLNQQHVLNNYRSQAAEYQKRNPDFTAAYESLITDRMEELQTMGITPELIQEMVHQEEMMIVAQAMRDNVNPAERVYAVAKRRGFGKREQSETVLAAAGRTNPMGSLRGNVPKGSMTLEKLSRLEGQEFLNAWDKYMKK